LNRPPAPFDRALVLTAGLGTRLHPLTLVRAKAAVPTDGEPLVRRVIRWLVASGVSDLVLNLHHRPESITAVVGDGSDLGARVRYSWEDPVLGSAGGPRHALPLLMESARDWTPVAPPYDGRLPPTLLLVNGDTLTDVDLRALGEQHARTGAWVTMALIPNPRPDKYGGVVLDGGHVVTGFTRRGHPGPSFHFIGVQAVDARVFAELEDGVAAESVLEVYPRLMAEWPGRVRGFVSDASFQDIGTPLDLLNTSLELAAAAGRPGRPAWGAGARVDPAARVTRSLLWDRVRVGAGATLTECVVADDVTVPAGAHFERCAIVRSEAAAGPGEERQGPLLVARLDR
jgi:NDP-sugar pyrophosphorylase family protein